jgi:hypothetical protein
MNSTLKISLQVVFLAVLIYALAALLGAAPGVSVRSRNFGARLGKGRGGRQCGGRQHRRNEWVASGMVGELIQSPGTNNPPVGIPQIGQ